MGMLDIADIAERAPFQLSGGQKKRVAIASVLVMNPDVLLFDEPTAALDPRTQQWLIELIQELSAHGKTIVMATHDLDVLDAIADRCLVFSEDHRILSRGRSRPRARRPGPAPRREPDPRAHPRPRGRDPALARTRPRAPSRRAPRRRGSRAELAPRPAPTCAFGGPSGEPLYPPMVCSLAGAESWEGG